MSANSLLLYMSARGQGSWQQFRAAVEELHLVESDSGSSVEDQDGGDPDALPLYQLLRLNLQRLGHAEFFAGASGSDWRVTPPSLAITGRLDGSIGILAGARSLKLIRHLQQAVQPLEMEILPLPAAPDHIRIVAPDSHSLVALADRTNLFVQHDAPIAILTILPRIDDAAILHKVELPIGKDWVIERFSTSGLRWTSVTHNDVNTARFGLFRFSLRHQRSFFISKQGQAFQVPGQVGKFLVLRHNRRKIVAYNGNNTLTIPAVCRPPFLLERALILCSGTLPSYDARTGLLRYSGIDRHTAELACGLLRQEC